MAGQRRTKAAIHGAKKKDFTISLTPEAALLLDGLAEQSNLSRSEFIERIARNQISLEGENLAMGELLAN